MYSNIIKDNLFDLFVNKSIFTKHEEGKYIIYINNIDKNISILFKIKKNDEIILSKDAFSIISYLYEKSYPIDDPYNCTVKFNFTELIHISKSDSIKYLIYKLCSSNINIVIQDNLRYDCLKKYEFNFTFLQSWISTSIIHDNHDCILKNDINKININPIIYMSFYPYF